MIDINSISSITRFSTAFYPGAKGKFSLMKEDYIILPFNTTSPVDFQIGDYVDLRGVLDASMGGKLAKIYQIVDMSYPTYKNGGYSYELRLDAYYWQWKTKIFKYTPEVGGQEASWSLTASLDAQLGVFLRNLKALGYTYEGKDFTFSIDETVENSAKFMSYDNINLLDAIFEMAKQWNCDCWVTDHVINFGRCEFSDPVKVELDVEAQDMSRSESKGTFATRIYAFGSTRNIPTSYRPVDTSMVVGGIVERRLMLPAGTPYVDAYEGMTDQEAIEAVVVFDDVYPHRVGTISGITSYESEVDNEDGSKTKATFYRFKDSGINFSKEYILEGNELKMRFQSGKLNGMEFGAMFNPLGLTEKNDDGTWNPDAQLWEIVLNEDYGRPLPDEILCPENGNTYVLTGWNSEKITELGLVASAEQELLAETKKYIAKTCIDDGTYTATLKSTWVYEDQINRSFDIGQRINLINPAYFKNGRTSRVIGFEIKLDLPYDSPEYTIGESAAYSRISDIETKVEELTFKGQTFTGSGGSNIYVIKTNDSTAASNFNVFSALYSLRMFLRKDAPDVADELITFLKGILIGKNGSGITTREDGTSQAVVDRLYVKVKAVFEELQVKKATHVGGEQIISHAGMKCIRVEELSRVYRCFFLAEQEGEAIANEFSVGSLAQAKECNFVDETTLNTSNRYYWREVMAIGRDYIDLSKTICDKGSDIPQPGDDIIGLGHRTDIDLQSAIILSSINETSPSIVFYAGINDFNLIERDIISFGLDKSTGHAYMKVYGTSYIGARDESTYIKYTPEGGVEIKGRFLSSTTGEDLMTMFSIMEGMIKSEISSVRNEINARDNYLGNAAFSDNLSGWMCGNNIRVFTVSDKLLSFNNNFYANKENFANIITDGSKNVLRLKNSGITQLNANFALHPEFDLYDIIGTDAEGNEAVIGEQYRSRMFYISFKYKVNRPGTLRIYFKGENQDGFEGYNSIEHTEYLEPGEDFKTMEIAGKWNGTGDFYLFFSGDMYLYSLALSDNRLDDAIEKFNMRFEATDKKIQANLDEIKKTGTKLEEYHSQFLLTARDLEIKFTEDLSDSEKRITSAYKSYVNLTARDLRIEFDADINNAESRITEAYTSAIKLSAQGLETKFTADITDMESGITSAYKSYVNLTAQKLEVGFSEDLTDLRTGVTEAYKSAIDLSARGLRADFNSSVSDLNGKLTTHTGSFHVTSTKIEAMVSATDSISNKITSAGWITTADGNKLWATTTQYNSLNQAVSTHTGSFHVTSTKIEGIVSDVTEQGASYSKLTQTVNGVVAEIKNARGDSTTLSVELGRIEGRIGSMEGDLSIFEQTAKRIEASVTASDGRLAVLQVTADNISQQVTSANGTLSSLKVRADQIEQKISGSEEDVTSINVRLGKVETVAGYFNADGTLKEGAGWVTTTFANSLFVKKNGIISAINQTAESVTIDAGKINLNGAITANGHFKIKLDGSIEAADAIMNNVTVNNMTLKGHIAGDGATLTKITVTNGARIGNFVVEGGGLYAENTVAIIGMSNSDYSTHMSAGQIVIDHPSTGNALIVRGGLCDIDFDVKSYSLRASRYYNAPGVLWAGTINSGGGVAKSWGDGCRVSSASRSQTGHYYINHDLGHGDYFAVVQPIDNGKQIAHVLLTRTTSQVGFRFTDLKDNWTDCEFSLFLFGNNK